MRGGVTRFGHRDALWRTGTLQSDHKSNFGSVERLVIWTQLHLPTYPPQDWLGILLSKRLMHNPSANEGPYACSCRRS